VIDVTGSTDDNGGNKGFVCRAPGAG